MSSYKKISMTQEQGSIGVCYRLLCSNLSDWILCTLSPNHNIHRINGVYQREQRVLWSQKVWCQKCIFQGSGDPHLLTLPVKKLNLLEKTAVDKKAWIKAWTRYRKMYLFNFQTLVTATSLISTVWDFEKRLVVLIWILTLIWWGWVGVRLLLSKTR